MTDRAKIRNFSIIAHIDHGKSTLADRLLEECHTIDKREMEDQILDSMDLERERGITDQSPRRHACTVPGRRRRELCPEPDRHAGPRGLQLRGLPEPRQPARARSWWWTPPRASRPRRWPTRYLAIDNDLEVLPVINKIDLPAARPQEVKQEVEDIIGIPAMDAPGNLRQKWDQHPRCAGDDRARTSPPPRATRTAPLQALIFDSQYDSYRGVVVYLRVFERPPCGRAWRSVKLMRHRRSQYNDRGGRLSQPHGAWLAAPARWSAGEVGYLTASIKTLSDTRVGDTVTGAGNSRRPRRCPATRPSSPWSSAGIYPADGAKYRRPAGCAGKAAAERRLHEL